MPTSIRLPSLFSRSCAAPLALCMPGHPRSTPRSAVRVILVFDDLLGMFHRYPKVAIPRREVTISLSVFPIPVRSDAAVGLDTHPL